MTYEFDIVHSREGTNSIKWDNEVLSEHFGKEDLLPFWVADMDFLTAPEIIEAVTERAKHGIYGYSNRDDEYFEIIANWIKRRFNWSIKKEWIEFTPGVVPAIGYLIQALTNEGDKILIQEPVYYPFAKSIEQNKRVVVSSDLIYKDNKYVIDFDDFEEKASDPNIKMFILCSPHNPIGRVWSKEELEKIGNICLENNVLVVSDEIHNDLVFSNYTHTIFGSINEEFENNSVVCTAPTKTFNLAGIQSSNVIIKNKEIMEKFKNILEKNHVGMQSPFSIVATKAAYKEGEAWLNELLSYLEENHAYLRDYLKENLPAAKLIEHQATYLVWIDFNEYTEDFEKLERAIIEVGQVALDGGSWFGEVGKGFMRMNIACPRKLLNKGLEGLKKAINSL